MIKRAIWVMAAFLVAAYFINDNIETRARVAAQKTKDDLIESSTKAAVAKIIEESNAIPNWENELSQGEHYRTQPILTLELEKLWLTQRPILFVGSIKDIATFDQDNYQVTVERNPLNQGRYLFATEFRLNLKCTKQQIDSILKLHPDLLKDFNFNSEVAVIADIDEISTITVPRVDNENDDMKIGKGNCINIIYVGAVNF